MIKSILRRASGTNKLNIITFSTHEAYQTTLSGVDANFYVFDGGGLKEWNLAYRPLPENHTLIKFDGGLTNLPTDITYDLVLGQNKYAHYDFAKGLARYLNIPLVWLEHCLPPPSNPRIVADAKSKLGDINVYISEYSRHLWDMDGAAVIHHGIDTQLFSPSDANKNDVVFSCCNDWINRDWCCGYNLWKEIVRKDVPVKVLGATPGLSEAAKDVNELVETYRTSRIFLNTSLISPVPTCLLEAMSAGTCVISTATCMIPEIIQNDYNGFISNDPKELRRKVFELLQNPAECERMGQNARDTILERFSKEQFVNNWTKLFSKTIREYI